MILHRLILVLAGAFATAAIAFGGLIAHGPEMASALGDALPLGPAIFGFMLLTYLAGLGIGWLVWNRKG